jgi:hypothetical protein
MPDWVSVTPDDYGNPVYGNILAWTPDEIVVRHEDPSVGKVNLRFPRVGFDVIPAKGRPPEKRREADPMQFDSSAPRPTVDLKAVSRVFDS